MTEKEEKTYSISELAKEFDITTRSIRFYEDQGPANAYYVAAKPASIAKRDRCVSSLSCAANA